MKQFLYGLLIICAVVISACLLTVAAASFIAWLDSDTRSAYQQLRDKHNQCIIDNRGIASAKEYCDVLVYGKVIR